MVSNKGVVTFNPASMSFVMEEDALVELSGMLGYRGGDGAASTVIVTNTTLQVKKNGAPTWIDYSSVRGVYAGTVNAYRNTLFIPPAMADLKKGDEIRMIVARAPEIIDDNGNVIKYLGNDHVVRSGTKATQTGIVVPYGTKFSKELSINKVRKFGEII